MLTKIGATYVDDLSDSTDEILLLWSRPNNGVRYSINARARA